MAEESTTPDLALLVQRRVDAMNARDFDAAMTFYAPDAVYDSSAMGLGRFEGSAAIRRLDRRPSGWTFDRVTAVNSCIRVPFAQPGELGERMFGSKKREEHEVATFVAQNEPRNDALEAFIESLLSEDGSMSEENVERFETWLGEHRPPEFLDRSSLSGGAETEYMTSMLRLRHILRGAQVAGAQEGIVIDQVDTSLILKPNEVAIVDEEANLLKEVTLREFRGGSAGISIPLGGRGVRARFGSYRGHIETIGKEWQNADTGFLTVTNQRIVFHGGRKTLEFPFAKLATLNAYSDGVELGITSRQATSKFGGLEDGEYVAAMIRALFVALEKQRAEEPGARGQGGDVADEIAKLAALRDQRILTEDEFATKKAELLARL
jgi:hypothetical protein